MSFRLRLFLVMAVFFSTAFAVYPVAAAPKKVTSAPELERAKKAAQLAAKNWDNETKRWNKTLKGDQGEQMLLLVVATANLHDAKRSRLMMQDASEVCISKHPAMKDDLEKSYKKFKHEADKALSTAGKSRDFLVERQTIGKKADINKYLKAYERAAQTRDVLIDTIPVSDEKDCKKLIKSLDKNTKLFPKQMRKTFLTGENQLAKLLEEEANPKKKKAAND